MVESGAHGVNRATRFTPSEGFPSPVAVPLSPTCFHPKTSAGCSPGPLPSCRHQLLHPLPSVSSFDRRPFRTLPQPLLDYRALLHRRVRCACTPFPVRLRPFLPWALFHFKAFLRPPQAVPSPGPHVALTPCIPLDNPTDPPLRRTLQQAAWRPSRVCSGSGVDDASLRLPTPKGVPPRRPSPSFMGFVTSKNVPRNAFLGQPPVARVSWGSNAWGVPTLAGRNFKGLPPPNQESGFPFRSPNAPHIPAY